MDHRPRNDRPCFMGSEQMALEDTIKICPTCGAVVALVYWDIHEQWHANMEKLLPPESTGSTGPGWCG